jgi:hypothetical protein
MKHLKSHLQVNLTVSKAYINKPRGKDIFSFLFQTLKWVVVMVVGVERMVLYVKKYMVKIMSDTRDDQF